MNQSKTFLFGLLLFAGSILLTCNKKEPLNLVWSDEFDVKGQPDSLKWTYDLGDGCPNICGWGNNEAQFYTKNNSNIRVQNGSLIIDAIKNGDRWTSARIKSQSRANFTYGRIEFRAKLPEGQGTWPALWMLGENVSTKGWPAGGEIDVMEHFGKNPGVVQSAMHTPSSFGDTVDKGATTVSTYHSDFHVYATNWTKDKIEFFVDDVSFYIYQPALKNAETWPYDNPFFIIMNIAMGGNAGGPIDPSLAHVSMEVDYVRVYQ